MIASGIDVAPVLAELAANEDLWNEHTARQTAPGGPHKQADDIWVRFNDVAPFEAGERPWSEFSNEHVPIWYRAWDALPSLRPIVFDLMAKVQGEMLCAVLITRIPPGSGVDPHSDSSWHVSYTDKFYISLQSEPGARFHCIEDTGAVESLEPKAGECWRFDNRKKHAVTNRSQVDRLTLIVCIRTEMFGRRKEEQCR